MVCMYTNLLTAGRRSFLTNKNLLKMQREVQGLRDMAAK